MKNTKSCPKCEQQNIMKIPSNNTGEQDSIMLGILQHIYINHYVCADCGYTEQWIDNQKALDQLKQKAIKKDWYLK